MIRDLQQSSLGLDIDTQTGTGSFDLRVSSEEGWDTVEFVLNGAVLERWSGEVPWRNFQFAVPAGRNHLEWRYRKDANFSAGLDAVLLDNLYMPVGRVGQPARLGISRAPTAAALIQVQGVAGWTYLLEASSDLMTWTPISTVLADSTTIVIEDRQATNLPARFYRVITQP